MSTQQSDIIITPDGKIHISFLWEDMRDFLSEDVAETTFSPPSWTAPEIELISFSDEYKQCLLCPKECGFNRKRYAHPTCGDDKLRVSNVGLSIGDEPEIRGSRGSGTIMLSGCPLTCPSCHNPEKVAQGEETSINIFLKMCEELLKQGAHNIQILSPTVHLPQLRAVLKILKEYHFPLPIVFKSSGYENVEELKKLDGLVDIYLPDFKFGSCSSWGSKAGVPDYFERSKDAIHEMLRQVGKPHIVEGVMLQGVLIRHVLAPLPETETSEIRDFLSGLEKAVISFQDTFVELE